MTTMKTQPATIATIAAREEAKKMITRHMEPTNPVRIFRRQPPVMNFQTITQKYPASKKPSKFGWKLKGENRSSVATDCMKPAKDKGTKIPIDSSPDQKNASKTSGIGTTAMYSRARIRHRQRNSENVGDFS